MPLPFVAVPAWLRGIGVFVICTFALGVYQPATADSNPPFGDALFFADDPRPSDTTQVHVRVLDRRSVDRLELRPSQGTLGLHLKTGGPAIFRVRPGQKAVAGVRNGEVYVQVNDRGVYASGLDLIPQDSATWALTTESGVQRTYTGGLHLQADPDDPGALLLVNAVPIEDYVASVVASEYGFDDLEGNKAMAVVARTYALRAAAKFDGRYDHVDHTHSQVYKGQAPVTGVARRATAETRGQVLTYDERLIEAVYFSTSGGHTANNEDVWDATSALPYLRGKRDPYGSGSPHHRWTTYVSRSKLLRVLSRRMDGDIEGFVIADRSDEGRVMWIELLRANGTRHRMQANAFRLFVTQAIPEAELRSTWFDARRSGERYVFTGRGYGHGVGLNQWGAHEMAKARGKTYREILTFYYTGVAIRRMDGVQVAAPMPPLAKDALPPPGEPTGRRIGW